MNLGDTSCYFVLLLLLLLLNLVFSLCETAHPIFSKKNGGSRRIEIEATLYRNATMKRSSPYYATPFEYNGRVQMTKTSEKTMKKSFLPFLLPSSLLFSRNKKTNFCRKSFHEQQICLSGTDSVFFLLRRP